MSKSANSFRSWVVLLYDSLMTIEPTSVVRLNRAVALAEAGWLKAALQSRKINSWAHRLQPERRPSSTIPAAPAS
jgi:predicted RNA polymerase sigma factor